MNNGYRYHVFLSYRRCRRVNGHVRDDEVELWVRQFFERELQRKLTNALEEPAEIFLDRDDIRTGDEWKLRIVRSLRRSCCIVPVWSPLYFQSDWCLSEWASFRRRQAKVIVPVVWNRTISLPPAAQRIQQTDVGPFTYVSQAFLKSDGYLRFEDLVRRFAQDVARAVKRAPEYDPGWPVVVPEVSDSLRDENVHPLRELEEYDQLITKRPSRIRYENIWLSESVVP